MKPQPVQLFTVHADDRYYPSPGFRVHGCFATVEEADKFTLDQGGRLSTDYIYVVRHEAEKPSAIVAAYERNKSGDPSAPSYVPTSTVKVHTGTGQTLASAD